MGSLYWNKHENVKANREGRIMPDQVLSLRKKLPGAVIGFVAGLASAALGAYALSAGSAGVGGLFILVGALGVWLSGSFFKSTKSVVDGKGTVRVLDGVARHERRRAAVHLYVGDEYVLCDAALTLKFVEGERYRAYIVESTRHLLSMELMD